MAWPLILAAAAAAANSKPGQRLTNKISDQLFGKDPNDQAAQDALARQHAEWDGITTPEQKQLDLQNYTYGGDIDPRLVQSGPQVAYNGINANTADAAMAGDSAMKGISTDPRLREAELSALLSMQQIGNSGGMTAEDRANLSRIQNQAAQADQGRRGAILQNAAARGMSGSGNELLAQLQSSQAATDRQSQEGLDIASQAQQRALQAIMQSGQLGSNLRSQDFGEQSQVAQAQDAISKFNAANTNSANQFNAGALNNASQFNAGNQLHTDMYNSDRTYDTSKTNTAAMNQAAAANQSNRQNVSNANVDINNKAAIYNNDAGQRAFDDQTKLAAGKTGVDQHALDYWDEKNKEGTQQQQNGIQGAGQIAASYYANKK